MNPPSRAFNATRTKTTAIAIGAFQRSGNSLAEPRSSRSGRLLSDTRANAATPAHDHQNARSDVKSARCSNVPNATKPAALSTMLGANENRTRRWRR